MSTEEDNKRFYKIADSFIDLANTHSDSCETSEVGSSMLFASARFSAFVVASFAKDKAAYEAEVDNAINHFSSEFKKMLTENLEQYKTAFDEGPKYEHLVKKET